MEPQREHGVLFREVQRFRQPALWILFLFDLLVLIGVGWLILRHEGVGSAAFVSYVIVAFLFGCGPPTHQCPLRRKRQGPNTPSL